MRFASLTALLTGAALLAGALSAKAEGERAGQFDYYVMALSWSPGWCATDGRGREAAQCARGSGASFVLHGLWPQNELGYPSDCRTPQHDPTRAQSAAMDDIMGSSGAAWYQWKKHGRCAGLSAADYYATARRAYAGTRIPEVFRNLDRDVKLPASVVEEAFIEANPGLTRDMVTITCDGGRIDEVRICLTKDLTPRRCGDDVIRDCRRQDALMERVR
ncbi:ribonuclease T2 family protein [Paenirhodobacter populi]|uniref:ribonuclease T2 family protein n=1 Tax=Paenirhodobacter populi TaxID=2306993 RepID=UPI000FE2C3F8|nr:ribonuclease T2 [Sinirhodobacter populi]RWR10160.1 ribonuclease T [Sinirhodobacter populi]